MEKRGLFVITALLLVIGFFLGYKGQSFKLQKQEQTLEIEHSKLSKGYKLFLKEKYEDSLLEFTKYIEEDQNNFEAQLGAGWSQYRLWYLDLDPNRLEESRNFFRNAAKIEPRGSSPFRGIAYTYLREEKFDEAIENFRWAVSRSDSLDKHRLLVGLGFAYLHTNDYGNAILQFKQANDLNSDYIYSFIGLATSYYELGNFEKAENATNSIRTYPVEEEAEQADYKIFQECMEQKTFRSSDVRDCGRKIFRGIEG